MQQKVGHPKMGDSKVRSCCVSSKCLHVGRRRIRAYGVRRARSVATLAISRAAHDAVCGCVQLEEWVGQL